MLYMLLIYCYPDNLLVTFYTIRTRDESKHATQSLDRREERSLHAAFGMPEAVLALCNSKQTQYESTRRYAIGWHNIKPSVELG